jgi:protein-S-isoprenylcysteine O-methyltransferase Ste14
MLARRRVALGFVTGAIVFWWARPSCGSVLAGGALALIGEAVRIWAAGHLEKGCEVTTSGPYRYMAHPLYVGSSLMGAGLAVASRSALVAVLIASYLLATIGAAIRREEADLRARFGDTYDGYRSNGGVPQPRSFSLDRVLKNREYRALAGLIVAVGTLAWKAGCW